MIPTVQANKFIPLWYRYEKMGVPDPTQTAINELLYPARVVIGQHARRQLENLVAYHRTHAKPGRVYLALKSRHYVETLANWKPTGAPQ